MRSNQFSVDVPRIRLITLKGDITAFYAHLADKRPSEYNIKTIVFLHMFQFFQVSRINVFQFVNLNTHSSFESTRFVDEAKMLLHKRNTLHYHTKNHTAHAFNRTRSPKEKQNLVSYWPSDANKSTEDELQDAPKHTQVIFRPLKPTLTSNSNHHSPLRLSSTTIHPNYFENPLLIITITRRIQQQDPSKQPAADDSRHP